MPTPARTSIEGIVAAGRRALAKDGLESLTMQRVAQEVGVRAPSLYKHVRNRAELVRLVIEDVLRDLAVTLEGAATTGDPPHDLRALARAFRRFAHQNPNAYGLLFSRVPQEFAPDSRLLETASAPMMRTATALAGPQRALPAARTITAWATGFVRMELAGGFQLGGDVDEAFEYGIDRLAEALSGS
ncbi:MAG TPA: WHG domain-containing protein [Candidatus Limnocylindria bacterium]